jgi:hypothetical protein
MKRRRRILLLGLALALLLAGGIGAVLLWPLPSEAERTAARIEVGTLWDQELELLARPGQRYLADSDYRERAMLATGSPRRRPAVDLTAIDSGTRRWRYVDGSTLNVTRDLEGCCVTSVFTTPPPPVHPLTRLRRTLARALPFLGE